MYLFKNKVSYERSSSETKFVKYRAQERFIEHKLVNLSRKCRKQGNKVVSPDKIRKTANTKKSKISKNSIPTIELKDGDLERIMKREEDNTSCLFNELKEILKTYLILKEKIMNETTDYYHRVSCFLI